MTSVAGPGHLFLSYSGHDREVVTEIARRLGHRGIEIYLDVLDPDIPGRRFLDVLEKGIESAGAVAVFIGATGLVGYERLEANLAIIHSVQRGLRVIPVLLPGVAEPSELSLFLKCFSWIDLRDGLDDAKIDRLARASQPVRPAETPDTAVVRRATLAELIPRATRHLVISGHTLDKFTRNLDVQGALLSVIKSGARITIVQLNPASPYAEAHRPFHELESASPSDDQHTQTVDFFLNLFRDMSSWQQQNLDVSFTNYMPRFRTVIVDDSVFAYLYMYGGEVADTPDLVLEPNEPATDLLRRRIIYSTNKLTYAPEAIPLIRCGQAFPHWRKKKMATWGSWTQEQRRRHRLTHDFYVTHAKVFHERFGRLLEQDLRAHLDRTSGRTLVLGCGSGKEVEYIASQRPADFVRGLDFSHVAVDVARQKRGQPERFLLGDFYDLDDLEFLDGQLFDSIVGNAAFVHLHQRDDIDDLLLKVYRRLTGKGVLFLRCLFKERQGKPLDEEIDESLTNRDGWGAGRWFVYYSRLELADRCRKAGFTVDDKATETIARTIHNARGSQLKTIMEKGFPHTEYASVYWSCVMATKSAVRPS